MVKESGDGIVPTSSTTSQLALVMLGNFINEKKIWKIRF